ncbi:MAG TPA: isoprenylcysteine carboxylmethyltransferase family protein [Longimicrobium sp.]|nr:isoprenylcysteine carboxylmethyltransferase family protein [Longimicrobium sp.]
MRILRHLLSILLLPFVMVVVVPRWIVVSRAASDTRWAGGTALGWLGRGAGALLFLAGFGLFAWCVALFARVGQGTLAPWDPTRRLVAVGPYRYMRNPMISGVLAMISGEALLLGSRAVAWWGAAFLAINQVYFLVLEEPGLARRFGEGYLRYKAAVPRWLPRRTPWSAE